MSHITSQTNGKQYLPHNKAAGQQITYNHLSTIAHTVTGSCLPQSRPQQQNLDEVYQWWLLDGGQYPLPSVGPTTLQ